ncbi:Multidrug resistance-associated protein 1 [Allomyces arbusculus]|nr:Multidrug resistance-associated protein 1 [Allomyces arbusculus]
MVLSVVNLVAAIFLLAQVDPSETASSAYFGWITTTLALAIAVPTHFFEHYRSRRPSTSLCTFYLILILILIVRLRTLLLRDMPDLVHIHSRPLIVTALVLLAENSSGKAIDLRTDPAVAYTAVPDATGVPTHESPEMSASYLSRLGLWWVHGLLREGRAKTLVLADCWSLPWRLRSHPTGDLLQAAWDHQVATRGTEPSFIRAFLAVFAPKLAVVSGTAIVVALTEFVNPLFVQYLIKLVLARGTKDERSVAEGVVVAVAYVIVSVLAAFLAGQKQHLSNLEQLRVQSAVQRVVYHKALQLPSHRSVDAGAVLAHAQVDAAGVASIMTSLIGWLPSPFTLAIALYMLYLQIGWSMVMAVAVITLSSPVVGSLGGKLMALRMAIMKQISARTKLMTETVGAMKTLRLYGWTGYLRDRILAIRDKELQLTITSMRFNAASVSMSDIVPSLAMFLTFAVFALTQPANALTSERVFVALALFNIVDQHTKIMLWAWTPLVDAKAAMDRVTEFLQSPERVAYVGHDAEDHEHPVAIEIDTAQFAFTEDKPVLSIDQLAIARGSVTAVVGKIGSGKSALLTAILGEMDKLEGRVTVRGSVAYVAQQPWIQHVSIRDNILFGRALDQERYDAVVQACALTSDFAALPKGDLTFVGEKGTNLSGGQRARVACARALYADSDIVLLDDPLSAVDAHVDRHMFDAWFDKEKGLLRGKTVVLVTHAMHHLDQVDRVLALSKGKIVEQGTYDEVMALNGVVTELVGEVIASRKDKASDKVAEAAADGSADRKDAESGAASSPPSDDSNEDENKETKSSGKVAWATYKAYLSYVGGWLSVVVLLSFVVTSGFQFSSTIFLGLWGSASSSGNGDDVGYWLGGYGGLLIAGAIAAVSSFYIVLAVVATRVARITMTKLLNAILRAPMSWWDVTPAGRILNRMTGDQRTVDRMIPSFSFQILAFVFQVLGTVITIVTATPWFLVVLIPITGIFLLVQRVYLASSRELERVTMAQASPVYQHITESLTGLATIRAFAHSARFQTDAEAKVDLAASGTYTLNATRWWLSVQLQLLSTAMIGVFGILAVSTPVSGTAILGTALTYAMQITGILAATIETSAMLENSLVSMERIQEYMDVPAEAREDTPFALDAAWPASGAVEFRDYSTTYRAGLDPVLKHINLQINPGERVGICGRTGSGKSSLMLALFRVLEATSGSIVIDGINIATVGLQDLRSRLTILPQEAVLFDAPLRANLDPAGTIDDAALWNALERASLVEYVRSLEGQLDAPLTRDSMSAGQAQLLCLARAIVRKSKVLVLDEATAAMDPVTDAVVQETVRREFEGCTVLTVAHRIGTIMDSDKIVVLDHGDVAEVGAPKDLLADPASLFYALANGSGLVG